MCCPPRLSLFLVAELVVRQSSPTIEAIIITVTASLGHFDKLSDRNALPFLLVQPVPGPKGPDAVEKVQGADDRHKNEAGAEVEGDVRYVHHQPHDPAVPFLLGGKELRQ